MTPPSPDIEGHLLRQAYGRLPAAMVLTFVVPLVCAVVWWSIFPANLVLAWCASLWALDLYCYVLWRRFRKADHRLETHGKWRALFAGAALLAGLAWAVGPSLMLQYTTGAQLILFVGLVLAVGGVATSVLAAQQLALSVFVAGLMLPPTFSAWLISSELGDIAALTLLCGTALMMVIGRSTSRATEDLVATQARLRSILDNALDAVIEVDVHGLITDWNLRAQDLFGLSRAEANGRSFQETLFPQRIWSADLNPVLRQLMAGVAPVLDHRVEVVALRHDGQEFPVEVAITRLKIGTAWHFTAFIADISARKAAEDQLRQQAMRDPLTGLPNRRYLVTRLEQALAASARNSQHGALLYIDLDKFKAVNDKLGHDAGDQLLKLVAERLLVCTRTGDTAARIGGDEFVVMLEALSTDAMTAADQAQGIGTKLLDGLGAAYAIGNEEINSTPSIGICLFSGQQTAIDELMRRADQAMYQAKAAGRNTMRLADNKV